MWYILGRSDDTIKVAGKRLGPAEAESVLVSHPKKLLKLPRSASLTRSRVSALVVFCVLAPGSQAGDSLREELKDMLVKSLGKPLAPKQVLFVSDLPKTRNAKVMRRMVKAAYLRQDPGDTSSLVNPEAVEEIRHAK
jgi:acetyl-CoA synthetase